jgi:hypothetical protein
MIEFKEIIEELKHERQQILEDLNAVDGKIAKIEARMAIMITEQENLLFDTKIEREKLIRLCKEHNYNDLKTQTAIKFFIDKEKTKDVWIWLCDVKKCHVEWDTVYHDKWKMKKELFGKVQNKQQNKEFVKE